MVRRFLVFSNVSQFPCAFLLALITLFSELNLCAQSSAADDALMRSRALELMENNKPFDALPLLEALADRHPTDAIVLVRLGSALVATAARDRDPERRKTAYQRARSFFVRAKELGQASDYVLAMIEQIPESGEVPPFSVNQDVDAAMREGEEAFASGDYTKALNAYQRALQLDPKSYEAALFTGDIYFTLSQTEKAAVWFARAIEINPDRETAYRYWADALMKEGNVDAARDKYIGAVVAEPYLQGTWIALYRWAQASGNHLAHPKIEFPNVVQRIEKDGQTTFNVDATAMLKEDGTSNWVAYEVTRFKWSCEKFAIMFPGEEEYRHTLREETEALGLVTRLVIEDVKKKKVKQLDPALAVLLKLSEAGMLESYVLISRADQGITQDYPTYRQANREKLQRYIAEFIISKDPEEK